MGVAVCPRCASDVALHEGRPFVSATGAVELWHTSCWSVRHARPVEEVTIIAPPPPLRSRLFAHGPRTAAAAAGIAVIALVSVKVHAQRPRAGLAAISIEPSEQVAVGMQSTEQEVAPPVPDDRARFPVPILHGMPLDEMYPSLLDWIHPVTATDLVLSTQQTGMFGAERVGIMRRECGQGHCGIDLGGPIGRPIVAVADGTVVRVERSELGRDGRSGRYVRIEHEDGTLTAYMHLDRVEPGLQVGDRVDGGQQIGTLGATAIVTAAPHCHFSLELPNIPGTHGDHANTHYADPAPFLVRATVIQAADRRRPEKPAF
jgi:murein DD-endopeptidase MepM/ murein hydrolase activator NlpD